MEAVLRLAAADPARFGEGDERFADRFVLSSMAHGFAAPQLEAAAVIGYPHVGALKNMEALDKAISKDRKQEEQPGALAWTVHGGDLPQVWPCRADPINVVMRQGKGRMTIDKSMRLSEFVSYNEAVDLSEYDPVELVRVEQLCRAAAIQRTAGAGVRVWKFDLDAYFRRTGKQRLDWWASAYVLPDGYGFDKRVQFGQREAPVLTSRESNFIIWVVRRELHAFDRAHPSVVPSVRAWQLLRSLQGGVVEERPGCLWAALGFTMIYVDDAGGSSIDDLLYTRAGLPVFGVWDPTALQFHFCDAGAIGAVHLRRPDAHYAIALLAVSWLGHVVAPGKGEAPGGALDLLGVHIDLLADQRRLTQLKCDTYGAAVREALVAPLVQNGGRRVQYGEFNSLVHRLLHASATVVLGRQHVHHCMQALRARNRMEQAVVLLYEPQLKELRWWLEQFADPARHCLPLASRLVFPFADLEHTLASYSDAARELGDPATSGFGAWAVLGNVMYYISGLWEPWELELYSINVLELAAENMGTFTFLEKAVALGRAVTHVVDFVDNTAAEYSADRGRPSQADMRALVQRRFDALDAARVFSAVERITSLDNEWADALSRGEQRTEDVLRMARAAGLSTEQLHPEPRWRDLSCLPRAVAADH